MNSNFIFQYANAIAMLALREYQRKASSYASGNAFGKVQAGYVSGNIPVLLPEESASTTGAKTHKVVQPAGNRQAALAASDVIHIPFDNDDKRIVTGKLVDVGSVVTDAEYLMGMRPVTPGNTLLASADTEQNTTSATYVKIKEFFATRPGRYRVSLELSRTGGQTDAIVRLLYPDGVTYVDASATASYVSTVYGTFGAFTLDMTVTAWWGAQIAVFLRNTSGPAQTGYIKNCRLKYADASLTMAPHDAVLLD